MRACNSCPFLKGTANIGAPDWLVDVMAGIKRSNLSHTCHKTDPKADGYIGHKDGKRSVCAGFLGMMINDRNECIDRDIGLMAVDGTFDFAEVPLEPCFDSVKDFVVHHGDFFLKSLKEIADNGKLK